MNSATTRRIVFRQVSGSFAMTLGALCFKVAVLFDPKLTPMAGSWVRILANILVAFLLFLCLHRGDFRGIIGIRPLWLIVFGILGSLTLSSFYFALYGLGVTLASFLLSCSSVFLLLFHSMASRSMPTKMQGGALIFTLLGLFFLAPFDDAPSLNLAFFVGLASGAFAALAYFVVAKKLTQEKPTSLMFYWGLLNLILYGLFCPLQELHLPTDGPPLWVLLASGFLAAFGQYLVNQSYSIEDNSWVSMVAFLAPVLAIPLEIFAFGKELLWTTLVGVTFILMGAYGALPRRDSLH